ncbi:MAG: sulfite exporter TauE/SafE family protein [Hydrogenophilaceae bacterium]|nr:sulfite exporter TauE/SafE family protein [Hydrogenophilaceae bacterium]
MPEISFDLHFVYAVAIIAFAYLVRGVAGFGSGLIAIPLLVLDGVPLTTAVPMVVLLDYLASTSQGLKNRSAIVWREILPLLPFTLIGVLTALYLFKTLDAALLTKVMGGLIIVYAIYSLLAPQPHEGHSRLWAIPAGGLGGLVGTLFGTGGPFYVVYLHLRGLDKTAFRATFATMFMLDGANRLIGYLATGLYNLESGLLIALMLPVMAISLYIGGHIHLRINQELFKRGISVLLIGSGTLLLFK